MIKHKHADLIHAWADGAEIESRYVFSQQTLHDWQEDKFPTWASNKEYRIKPEEKKPVVRWLWANKNHLGDFGLTSLFMSDDERNNLSNRDRFTKLEWSRTEFPE